MRQARTLGHNFIALDHLLLGLMPGIEDHKEFIHRRKRRADVHGGEVLV